MIYLWEGTTEESLTLARERFLEHFICSATGHVPATRYGLNWTTCLCGAWKRQVTWPADDEVSMVTVNALRDEVKQVQARMIDLRLALEEAVEYLNDGGHEAIADRLTAVLDGRKTT